MVNRRENRECVNGALIGIPSKKQYSGLGHECTVQPHHAPHYSVISILHVMYVENDLIIY